MLLRESLRTSDNPVFKVINKRCGGTIQARDRIRYPFNPFFPLPAFLLFFPPGSSRKVTFQLEQCVSKIKASCSEVLTFGDIGDRCHKW